MRKPLSVILIVSMLMMSFTPAVFAQEIGGTDPEDTTEISEDLLTDGSWMTCHKQGEDDAQARSTSGSTIAGFASGFLLGLIGTGIVVLAQSKSEPSDSVMMSLEEASEECQYAYTQAFEDESIKMKRKSALTGGLIGTAVLVAIYLAAEGGSN
jgi:hypothetical protein